MPPKIKKKLPKNTSSANPKQVNKEFGGKEAIREMGGYVSRPTKILQEEEARMPPIRVTKELRPVESRSRTSGEGVPFPKEKKPNMTVHMSKKTRILK